MQKPIHQIYYFDEFTLDLTRGCLLRESEVIRLRPKSFEVLKFLIENSGRLVSKDELIKYVWMNTAVTDDSLVQCLKDIRLALNDKSQAYIKTVPRRGYIFEKEVSENGAKIFTEETIGVHVVIEEATLRSGEEKKERKRTFLNIAKQNRRATIFVLASLIVVVTVFCYLWIRSDSKQTEMQMPIKSIAVLPFKIPSKESGNEYLEAGMSDALIKKLSKLKQIIVRPSESVAKYAEQKQDAVTIGRELKVDAVLEGTIEQIDEQISLTVQLTETTNGKQLWTKTYDETFKNIFTVQDLITKSVAQSLNIRLSREENELLTKHYTDNTKAYQAYLKGVYFLSSYTVENQPKALEYFQQAIENDPNYALAYAGLSDYYLYANDLSPSESALKAKAVAAKALELDDTLVEAHLATGLIKMIYDWDLSGAEKDFKRVLELNPNNTTGLVRRSNVLFLQERFDEAVADARRAQEIQPLSLNISSNLSNVLYIAHRYDESIEQCKKVIEMNDKIFHPHVLLAQNLVQKGMYDEAIAEFKKAISLSGGDHDPSGQLGYVYAISGKQNEARKLLDELKEISKKEYITPPAIAVLYTGLGERDPAFEWLERGLRERSPDMLGIKTNPLFNSLHSDPRFADLVRRVGLTP